VNERRSPNPIAEIDAAAPMSWMVAADVLMRSRAGAARIEPLADGRVRLAPLQFVRVEQSGSSPGS
jgi:hypothetical protein